jgi:CDP-diacylglycerol pyrophosphatase
VNPFRLLADNLTAGDDMGAQTLVVVGTTGDDGREGVVLLAGRAGAARPATSSIDPANAGGGHGEALQDHDACPPAAEVMGK